MLSASFILSTFAALFFVVNPIGVVAVFLAMTASDTPSSRRRTASWAAIATFITLSTFAAAGAWVFWVLGVSIGALRIAGGILLFLLALDMLRAQPSRQRTSPEEEAEGVEKVDVSIFPLAIPMLAGPGAISTVVLLVSRAARVGEYLVVFLSIALASMATYWILVAAIRIEKRLGKVGINVLQRVMGLILGAIAVQFVVDGLSDVLPSIIESVNGGRPASPRS